MRMLPPLLFLCCLAAALPAGARMYEWVNPASGRVQLSGSPPGWYRAPAPGPRVRVFENGALVDDTAIALSAEENAALREYAVSRARQNRELAALRELEEVASREAAKREAATIAEQQRAERERRRAEREAALAVAGEDAPADGADEPVLPETLDAETIERLKALIGAFDRVGGAR